MTNNFNNTEDPFFTNNDPFASQVNTSSEGDPFGFSSNDNNTSFNTDNQESEPFSINFESKPFEDISNELLNSTPKFGEDVRDVNYAEDDLLVEDPFDEPDEPDEPVNNARPDPFKMKPEPYNEADATNLGVGEDPHNFTSTSGNIRETAVGVKQDSNESETFYSGFSYGMSILGFIYIIQTVLELI